MKYPNPGDVLAVRSKGWAGRLIRLGAALLDKPNIENHIVIASHVDAAGTYWGVEARAGGVGWVDMRTYTASRWTVTNAGQPKTDAQRQAVVKAARGMLGTSYDWAAILNDGLMSLHITSLWASGPWYPDGKPPAHVVCSSLADYVYAKVGLAHPGNGRNTTPADWCEFIKLRKWEIS